MNAELLKSIKNPFKFGLLMLLKLPMGLLAGLRLVDVSSQRAVVSVCYMYVNKNPFRSIYFGSLAMAGELAAGVLGMVHTMDIKPSVSMLVIRMEAEFVKKAKGKVFFTCEDGEQIGKAAEETRLTGQPVSLVTISIGRDELGQEIAKFVITWSLKAKI